jgi:hypothetical protein
LIARAGTDFGRFKQTETKKEGSTSLLRRRKRKRRSKKKKKKWVLPLSLTIKRKDKTNLGFFLTVTGEEVWRTVKCEDKKKGGVRRLSVATSSHKTLGSDGENLKE